MARDIFCPLYAWDVCYEMVAHGFSEKQMRELGEMKLCDMGRDNNGGNILHYHYCPTYGAFKTVSQIPGGISHECMKAIHDAQSRQIPDGKIVDLESRSILMALFEKTPEQHELTF